MMILWAWWRQSGIPISPIATIPRSGLDVHVCRKHRLLAGIAALGAALPLVELNALPRDLDDVSAPVGYFALANVLQELVVDDRRAGREGNDQLPCPLTITSASHAANPALPRPDSCGGAVKGLTLGRGPSWAAKGIRDRGSGTCE